MPGNNRLESMKFNYETSNRTDYRDGEIKPPIVTKYKEKPVCVGIRPPPLKYIHTLRQWETPIVPIDLYLKPKEIVQTKPSDVQKEYGHLTDLEKERVQKTRPRLVMTPAISLDDIDDEIRTMLVEDIYETTAKRAMRLGIEGAKHGGLDVPRPIIPAPPNPMAIPKLNMPYVSPEWRMDSISWDGRQIRTHADPTKRFWLEREPKCEECKATAARNALKRIKLG